LSFAFKLELLEGKRYGEASKIAHKIKSEYFSRYFGKDLEIQKYAEELIKAGRKDAALYLNEIVNVMGTSVFEYQIKDKINKRYSGLEKLLKMRRAYAEILLFDSCNSPPATLLIELYGEKIKNRIFSNRIDIELDGESFSFENENKYCKFVLERFSEYA